MKENNTILEVVDVEKYYKTQSGETVLAVENLSLTVNEGEFVTIVGPTACGKSTLLRIVSGLMPPTKGIVKIRGRQITEPYPGVGMCFQTPVLLQWRSVYKNVQLPLEIREGDENLGVYKEKIDSLLKLVHLEEFTNKYPFELSGGMQQRVSMARALVSDPDVLLMDEPFGALDALTRADLGNELVRIWQATGKTILFVTHDIPEAVSLATRVIILSARPARVVDNIPISVARPRDCDTPEVTDICRKIRQQIQITR